MRAQSGGGRNGVGPTKSRGAAWGLAVLCLALLAPSLVLVDGAVHAPDAGADVYSVFPADSFGSPNNVFRADEALFVSLVSDLDGGWVCVVDAAVQLPEQANCRAPAWGKPNFYVGLGTLLGMPLEAPLLPVGQWRLLGTGPDPSQGLIVSDTFTVLPCAGECDTGPATAVLAGWKARAGGVADGTEVVCRAFDVMDIKDLVGAANAARGMAIGLGGGLLGWGLGAVAGAGSFFMPDTSTEAMAISLFKDLSCGVSRMMADIRDDPPDFDYGTVAAPQFRNVPPSGLAEYDDLLASMEAAEAYGVASRIAFERYQGAMIDGDTAAAALQADATAQFTRLLVQELRFIDAVLPGVATHPVFADPLTTPEAFTEALALRDRINTDGLTSDEIAQLEALGFAPGGIAQIEAVIAEDISDVDISMTGRALLEDVATEIGDAIDPFDQFGRQLSVAAAELEKDIVDNQRPVSSFTATPTSGTAPLEVTFTSTATDPDGDELTLTWDIAGAATFGGPEVTYTFENPGTYWVSLVADDGELWDQAIQRIDVYPAPSANRPPVASFTSTATVGEAPLEVTFTSTSIDPDGDELTATWYFGDGQVLEGDEVTRTFTQPAIYSVLLVVSDGELTDTAAGEVTAGLPPPNQPPEASFSAVPTTGTAPLEVSFSSTATDPDDDELTVSWNFGDGTTATGDTATHTYTTPGTYTATLLVSDGSLIDTATTTIQVDEPPPALVSDFTTSKGYDAAKSGSGARIVSVTSEFSASTQAPNVLLPTTATWQSATGENTNQEIVVELAGGGLDLIDRIELFNGTGTAGIRNVEVAVSADGLDDPDFTTVITAELTPAVVNGFDIEPQRVRYLRIRGIDNGGSVRMQLREVMALTPDRVGGIVSLPEGPPASVVGVSSEISNDTGDRAIDRSTTTRWRSATGQTTDQWLRVALGGEGVHRLNRVLLLGANITQDPRNLEILVSETGDDGSWTTVLTAEAAQSNQPQIFAFPPVDARYVELRVLDNHGANWVAVNDFHAITTSGLNVADGEGVGATVTSVSSETSSRPGINAIAHGTTLWQTATGANTNQQLTTLLRNGDVHTIDRVMIASNQNRPRNVTVQVSDTGQAPGNFRAVATAELPNTNDEHWLVFPPVEARYVRLLVEDGYGSTIVVRDLRVFSPDRGDGQAVPFVDLSTPVDSPVASWSWDFGDGSTSTNQHPTHTFPGPGTYPVTLTVTDGEGVTSSHTRDHTVVGGPELQVVATAGATTVDEMAFVGLQAVNLSGDPILQWAWDFGYAQPPNNVTTISARFPDDGTYDVRVRGLTADWLWVESPPLTFTVLNVPPTVNAGADQTVYVDAPFSPQSTVSDPADTPSCVWDWGDGTTSAVINPCFTSHSRISHAYTSPGVYTATLTADDGDGGVTSDTVEVTVQQRPSVLQILAAEPDGDDLRVVARLHEGIDGQRLEGLEVTVSTANPTSVTETTDTAGEVEVLLVDRADAEEVTVSFGGSTNYEPTELTRAVQAPLADIVFMVDESGSMGGYQAAMRERLREISQGLGAHLDFRLGLIGFPSAGTSGQIRSALTDDLTAYTGSVGQLSTGGGGQENGFGATVLGMSGDMGFRDNAAVCAVIITDEDATTNVAPNMPETKDDALAALEARRATFFGIILPTYRDSLGDYASPDGLAGLTGGDWWDIRDFRDDASEVLDALVDSCVIRALQPDLALDKVADTEEVGPEDEVTYTLTVSNPSAVTVTGIELVDVLPDEVEFLSASDGGSFDSETSAVSWPTFSLAPGAEAVRTVTVQTASAASLGLGEHPATNEAVVADDGTQGPDRDPSDNEDSATVVIVVDQLPTTTTTSTTTTSTTTPTTTSTTTSTTSTTVPTTTSTTTSTSTTLPTTTSTTSSTVPTTTSSTTTTEPPGTTSTTEPPVTSSTTEAPGTTGPPDTTVPVSPGDPVTPDEGGGQGASVPDGDVLAQQEQAGVGSDRQDDGSRTTGPLPVTGAGLVPVVMLALALLLGGVTLLDGSRRVRRRKDHLPR